MKIYFPILKIEFIEVKRPNKKDFRGEPIWSNYLSFIMKTKDNKKYEGEKFLELKLFLIIPFAIIIFMFRKIEWWIAK